MLATMKEAFDWVGTTETLSNETLPLVYKILGKAPEVEDESGAVLNKSKKHEFEDSMDEESFRTLYDIMSFDHKIYSNVVKDYVFSEMYPELM